MFSSLQALSSPQDPQQPDSAPAPVHSPPPSSDPRPPPLLPSVPAHTLPVPGTALPPTPPPSRPPRHSFFPFRPPHFLSPPSPPLPPPGCELCVSFCISTNTVRSPSQPPRPSQLTCDLLATYLAVATTQISAGSNWLFFACVAVTPSCVKVCSTGTNQSTGMLCAAFSSPDIMQTTFPVVKANIGYAGYRCNMGLVVVGSCGCQYSNGEGRGAGIKGVNVGLAE